METSKPGLASAPVNISSVAAQTEKRMDARGPLTAVYLQPVPALPARPHFQSPTPAPDLDALHLPAPPFTLLEFHIVGGLQSQPGFSPASAAPAARPRSVGKHVCIHCGRDCMKPSVLEKHLRCHTGERPYPCTVCGVSFKTQSNLYKHKRTQAHARLSYESEQSSVDSISSSRDTSTSSFSFDECSKECGSLEKDNHIHERACPSTSTNNALEVHGTLAEPMQFVNGGQKAELNKGEPAVGRHQPLQRQEATLFSKQWETSACRTKAQSHESTDSGFSEGGDHSMDSLNKSTAEVPEETMSALVPSEPCHNVQAPKGATRKLQEQKTLEERISKLISENSAVVEDKQLEHVRPRKTVLSKQGSIDLPMPYTYKDSFHFDMRISKAINVGMHRNKNPGLYSSGPTSQCTGTEHAPLIRSNSLPYSVTLLQPERGSPSSSYQSDYATLIRRGSSGQINPTDFAIKPASQQPSSHRPLVRQTAVDCNHATDAPSINSSMEEACASSLSCDGDGSDICGEPNNRKLRRKKAQKFAYNKWYMYGGGRFKKLYDGGDGGTIKGRKSSLNPEQEIFQGLQKRMSAVHKETEMATRSTGSFTGSNTTTCLSAKPCGGDVNPDTNQQHSSNSTLQPSVHRNSSLSTLPSPSNGSLVPKNADVKNKTEVESVTDKQKHVDPASGVCSTHVPSDRKKQKTDDKMINSVVMKTGQNTLIHSPPSVTGCWPQHSTDLSYVNLQTNPSHTQPKGTALPPCIINANVRAGNTSTAKTTFLPKYQLKFPKSADSTPGLHGADKTTGIEGSGVKQCSVLNRDPESAPVEVPSSVTPSLPENTPITTEKTVTYALAPSLSSHKDSSGSGDPGQLGLASVSEDCGSTAPKMPCNIVPCESKLPTGQNVFHVHTADLQICLEIISDEQLALIEPQIERPTGSGPSPKHNMEEAASKMIQSRTHKSEAKDPERSRHEKNSELCESLPVQTTNDINPPRPFQNLPMADHSHSTPDQSKPPKAIGLSLQQHGHENTTAETPGRAGVASTAVSLKRIKSRGAQTSCEEQALSVNRSAEDESSLEGEGKGGALSRWLPGQQKVITTRSAGAIREKHLKNVFMVKGSQHKCTRNTHTENAKEKVSKQDHGKMRFNQASRASCTDELSCRTLAINQSKEPRRENPEVSFPCDVPKESTSADNLQPSEHANVERHSPGGLNTPRSLSEDLSRVHTELFTSVSSNIQMDTSKDGRATSVQRVTAGVQVEVSVPGCPNPCLSPRRFESNEGRQKQAGVEVQQTVQGQEGKAALGEDNWKMDRVPGQQEILLQQRRISGGEDREVKVDSSKNSRRSERQLSQTHSGMSACPRLPPNTSNNTNSPPGSSRTGPLSFPHETILACFSERQGAGIARQPDLSGPATTQGFLARAKHTYSQVEPVVQQTLNPTTTQQQGYAASGYISAANCCCNKSTSGSHKSPTLSCDVKTSSAGRLSQAGAAVSTGEHGTTDGKVAESCAGRLSEPSSCSQPEGASDASNPRGADAAKSFFVAAQCQADQTAECVIGGSRPTCGQEYTLDTSSSDDEDKLIIEL